MSSRDNARPFHTKANPILLTDLQKEIRDLKLQFEDAIAIGGYLSIPNDMKPSTATDADPETADLLQSFTTLDALEKYVSETVLIPLDETRKNPVFGVGNPNANLMVVGEAPGADEDEKGEPFVGRAGQLLNKILAGIHFTREEVYIANILKSRPPKNRNPLPEEIEKHIPILHRQIELVDPKIILCVGKVAANTLLGNSDSLGSMRGKLHDLSGRPVVVTYHPAALLRNPNWKPNTWEDVKFLRAQHDKLVKQSA